MKTLIDLIAENVKDAFVSAGYDEKYAKVTLSNRPDLCEYQCNGAMAAAKEYKKAPIMIAGEVLEHIKEKEMFSSIEAVMPGFINFSISSSYLAGYINEMNEDVLLGCNKVDNPKTIVIDYGGANVAKPLHVGHLRSAVIGESIKRMFKYLGHKVVGDVHLGDWGLQMGLIITELQERKPDLVYFDENYDNEYPSEAPFTISELEEIYPCASAKSKQDEAFKEKAHMATLRLQQGYAPYRAIWKHILNVSVEDLKKNYGNLNVSFDLWKGESDADEYIPEMIEVLKEKNLLHESEGAMVVDVVEESDTKEVPPCIIQKSDGAALYATSDLATLVQREKDYDPDMVVYVVDKRQEMHFTQVFRVAKKAGIVKDDTQLVFNGFGTMNGKDGKPFKTREGGVMRLENLMKEINDAVFEKMMDNRSISEEEARKTAEIVGLAALKYGDLSNQAAKDYVFDIERFSSFEGNTGPYILYTIVRIKSILNKYLEENQIEDTMILAPGGDSEKELMLLLARYNDVIENAIQDLAPHKICAYIYELSNAFNKFYHETKILTCEDEKRKRSYINLISLAKKGLEECIDLLGFSAPDRM
ncbi:MAG: arginine--tRNA ligase [Lachnospiraceae bacterium]|nr:arginine--tRNA ligase [Lachnospiraceae bacterium]